MYGWSGETEYDLRGRRGQYGTIAVHTGVYERTSGVGPCNEVAILGWLASMAAERRRAKPPAVLTNLPDDVRL